MTAAMMSLKRRAALALPVHDSLIVPQSAARIAKEALAQAFRSQLGLTPRLKVAGMPTAWPATSQRIHARGPGVVAAIQSAAKCTS